MAINDENRGTGWTIWLFVLSVILIGLVIIGGFVIICNLPKKPASPVTEPTNQPEIGNVLGSVTNAGPSVPTPTPTPIPISTPSSSPDNSPTATPSAATPSPIPNSGAGMVAVYPTPTGEPVATPPPNHIQLPFVEAFENTLDNWEVTGDVLLINQLQNPDQFTKPYHGLQMVRIGRPTNQGKPVTQNHIRMNVPVNAHQLSFAYNFFTYDYAGFDDPGFTVTINDQIIFQILAGDIDTDSPQTTTEHLDQTGWKQINVNLSKFLQNQNNILTFSAGNDDLNLPTAAEHQSWVYLDEIKVE